MANTFLNNYCNIENEILIINVAGCRFETYRKTLKKYPETLLGSNKIESFYNKESKEYFFDRDSNIFRYIINYYRSGNLHFPKNECSFNYEEELKFFGISPEVIDDCCYGNYKNFQNEINDLNFDDNLLLDDNNKKEMKLKEKIWEILENPHTSKISLTYYFVSSFLLIVAVVLNFILWEICNLNLNCGYMKNYIIITYNLEFILTIFAFEYFVRLFTTPNKLKFASSFFGMIDLLTIVPLYISYTGIYVDNKTYSFVVWKLFRLMNFYKFPNNIQPFKILCNAIKSSRIGLSFFITLFVIANIIFSTSMFYVEENVPDTEFKTITTILWYTIVTMTTLGYGDMVPKTIQGRIVTFLCAIFGITIITLLLSVLILNFVKIYQQNLKSNKYKEHKVSKLRKINNKIELSEVKLINRKK